MSRLELKIPPVAVVLLAGLIMWLVAVALPSLAFPFPYQIVLALVFAAAGILVAVLGVASFVRAGTTVDPTRPQGASSLVDDGIYRFTRNPMYLGFLVFLVGWAIFLAHVVALAVVPVFVISRLVHHPSVTRGRQAQWLWCFATERTGGVLACTLRMRDRAKRRRRGPGGAAVGRVVNKVGFI
jgi:protein-S-isoprenylcysteine O-methyltransferase Ste14